MVPILILAVDKRSYVMLSLLASISDLVLIDGVHREELMDSLSTYKIDWKTIMVHDSERVQYHSNLDKLKAFGEDISPEGINLFVCKRD